jgi:hypothetical protein
VDIEARRIDQPLVPPDVDMHIDVSNVQVTGSHDSVPPFKPRLLQSKPCRSEPSHCSPGLIMPSPQPAGPLSSDGAESLDESAGAVVCVVAVVSPALLLLPVLLAPLVEVLSSPPPLLVEPPAVIEPPAVAVKPGSSTSLPHAPTRSTQATMNALRTMGSLWRRWRLAVKSFAATSMRCGLTFSTRTARESHHPAAMFPAPCRGSLAGNDATVTRFATRSERFGYPAGVQRGHQPSLFSSSIAIAVALTLPSTAIARVLEPPTSGAAAPAASSEPTAAAGDAKPVDMDEVKRIYAEGKAKYDTHDYKGAIDAWTEALSLLPPVTENREIRNDLVYNIATAQERAYDIDKDAAHLRSARALLVDFVDEYKRLYTPTDEARAEVTRVKERIAKLDQRIADAEKGQPVANPHGTTNVEAKRKAAALQQVFADDPELARQYKSGRGMIIGGAVALGVGVLSLLVCAAAISEARDGGSNRGVDRGIAFAFGSVGVAGVVAGSVLLGIGVPKRKKALETARSRVVLAPTLGPGTGLAGLGLVGRF